MTKRTKSEILPTMKIKVTGDNDVSFKECQATIEGFVDVETKFGSKTIATLKDNNGKRFQIFVNATSMNKLIDAWGEDDDAYKGKLVNLKKEKDSHFNNEMIVLIPLK